MNSVRMKTFLIVALVVFLTQSTVNAKCIKNSTKPGKVITYSKLAVQGQFPFQVHLDMVDLGNSCGGTLIDSTHVLTAAHCIKHKDRNTGEILIAQTIAAKFGMLQRNDPNIIRIYSKKIFLHENYSGEDGNVVRNDVAIILLETPVEVSDTIKPADLTFNVVEPETIALISGWGSLESFNGPYPNDLMFAEVKVISNEECQKIYDYNIGRLNVMDPGHLCTVRSEGTGGPCAGDSGGPLSVNGEVVGIISSVINDIFGVCITDLPAVYMKISHYKDWIEETLKKTE